MKLSALLLKTLPLIIAVGMFAACGPREHIRPDHGRQSRKYFVKQRLNKKAAKGSPRGLDSEEAAIIHATHRRQLGAEKAESAGPSKVLLVQESKDGKK